MEGEARREHLKRIRQGASDVTEPIISAKLHRAAPRDRASAVEPTSTQTSHVRGSTSRTEELMFEDLQVHQSNHHKADDKHTSEQMDVCEDAAAPDPAVANGCDPAISEGMIPFLTAYRRRILGLLNGRIRPRVPPPGALHPNTNGDKQTSSARQSSTNWGDQVRDLVELLRATVDRGEGNSVLVMGNKAGGKTLVVASALDIFRHREMERTCTILHLDCA